MSRFSHISSKAAVLLFPALTADKIIPECCECETSAAELKDCLFQHFRKMSPAVQLSMGFDDDFIGERQILIAGVDCGVGDNAEMAVRGLVAVGYRAVMAINFGADFVHASKKHDLVLIEMSPDMVEIFSILAKQGLRFEVDVQARTISTLGATGVPFGEPTIQSMPDFALYG